MALREVAAWPSSKWSPRAACLEAGGSAGTNGLTNQTAEIGEIDTTGAGTPTVAGTVAVTRNSVDSDHQSRSPR